MIISTSYGNPGMGSIASMVLPTGVINAVDSLPSWLTEPLNQAEQSYGTPLALGAGIVGLYFLLR